MVELLTEKGIECGLLIEKEIENEILDIENTDVMTGDNNNNRYLYNQLKLSIKKAKKIDIIVSFLMETGVKMILDDLKLAIDRGVQVRLLTGNYLGITQPSALYLIKKELGDCVDLRFYNDKGRSFHPKSYIFHYENSSEIYIGSSNLSRSALTSGIEWNYKFSNIIDAKNFNLFYQTFEDLFENHSIIIDDEELKRYSKNWHKPAVSKDLEKHDKEYEDLEDKLQELFQPRGAQIEALYALNDSRDEGAKKGLIQAATGVGKTYLAAFDSAKYKKVLFVAHREEILNQAAISFKNVRNSDDYGFFNGNQKDIDNSVIFASVATLGRSEYLQEKYFPPDYFEYIVIDEFHHAVNDQYRRIIDYFKPKFLLGLTATPERMDGRNIYEICDYNVPYEISLKEAINKGMLVPFHYYGIYDETDYSRLHVVRGRYDEKELNETYIGNVRRYDLIYKYYMKYNSKCTLGFCCSRLHAEEMAKEFCRRGILSVAVYSNSNGQFSENREDALEKLKSGKIKVIFSVDMFNEGLDVPNVDMVLFLRPTESPIVFLQQLGRGLRKSNGKTYLNVLDFIGNYQKAGKTPLMLSDSNNGSQEVGQANIHKLEYPDDCIVDFDMRLVDLFVELEKKGLTIKDRIQKEYYNVKDIIGDKVPTRMELFTYMEDEIYELCMKNSNINPFRRYLDFLKDLNELTKTQLDFYNSIGREFLNVIETTNMQKVYKMPILYSFYNSGDIKIALTEKDILKSWKTFFSTTTNWKDLGYNSSYEEYLEIPDKQHLSNAKKNPIKFLKASGKGFFVDKAGYSIALREELKDVVGTEVMKAQMKDVIEYRTMEYYRRRYKMKVET